MGLVYTCNLETQTFEKNDAVFSMSPEGNCGIADPSFGSFKIDPLMCRDQKQDLALN